MNVKKLKFIVEIAFVVLTLVVASPTAFGMTRAAEVGRSPQGQDPVSPAATVRWQSAVNGNWSDGSKWSTGYAPGAGDDVIIDIAGYYTVIVDTNVAVKSLTLGGASGGTQTLSIGSSRTLTLNGDSTVGASGVVELSGGTLDGAGSLTVDGSFDWSGGKVQSTGVLTVNSTLDFSGTSGKFMDGCTITNKGSIRVTGAGALYASNGATITNQVGATFEFQTDADISYTSGDTTHLNNAGTLRKSAGSGATYIGMEVNNTGTVEVSSGILELKGGGAHTGDFAIASGCTLQFSGGTHSLDGVDFTGSGTVNITSGEVDTTGAGATLSSDTPLVLSGGYPAPILGGSGPLTLNGPFEWGHANIQGTGALTNNATMTISGTDAKVMDTRTITNKGTANVTGTGIVYFQNGASFDNQAGATFDIQADANLRYSSGSVTFTNAGTVSTSAGTGTATIDMDFTNSGGVDVNTGSLIFGKNLTNNSNGVVAVASGASMSVNGTLTNNGELRQTQDVNGSGDIAFFDTGGYGGAILNANGADLGSTTVTIKGNQDCTTSSGDTVKRCFDIAPTNATGRNAIITFYFADSEIPAGQSCASTDGYHWNGTGWEKLTLDDSYGTSGRDCSSAPRSLRVKNVAAFSPFVLKTGAPTAVTLRSFAAGPATDVPWGLLLFSLSAAVLVAVWQRRR